MTLILRGKKINTTTPPVTQLAAPSLGFSNITTSSARISWNVVPNASNYILERSTASNFSGATQIYGGSNTFFDDSGLSSNTTYYYRCKARATGYTDSNYGTISIQTLTSSSTIRNVGTGSGTLNINHSAFTINPGDTVVIAPGSYNQINIDIQGTDGNIITIINGDGLVEVDGGRIDLTTPRNLKVSGTGKIGLQYGFHVHGSSFKGTVIQGSSASYRNFTLEYIHYEDISDAVIDLRDIPTYNSGNEANTVHLNVKLTNLRVENAGPTYINGEWNTDTLVNKGLYRNLEISFNTWFNCPQMGNAIYLFNAEDYNIHHNVLDQVNLELTNHNGIFALQGHGSFYNNKCTNHQGNLVRFWPHTKGTTKANVYCYNNIVWNSLKYSAFEVQTFSYQVAPPLSVSVDFFFYNNTVGKMNTNHDWQGVLLDKYNIRGGFLTVRNNIVYDSWSDASPDHIINYAGEGTGNQTLSNNVYYSTFAATGLVNETSFKPGTGSPLLGAGMNIGSPVTVDYYGITRPNPPAIGAAEQ